VNPPVISNVQLPHRGNLKPDALTPGPLAAKLGSQVLLVSSSRGLLPVQQQVLAGKHSKYVHQVGGGVNPTTVIEVVK
jgi:hypothetical protein